METVIENQKSMPLEHNSSDMKRVCVSMSENDVFRMELFRTLFRMPNSRKERLESDGKLVSLALMALQGILNEYRAESGVEFPTYEEVLKFVKDRQGKAVI